MILRDLRTTTFVKTVTLLLIPLIIGSCATASQFTPGKGNKYQYRYRLIAPIANDDLLYQDDAVIIQFRFDEAAVKFQLQNISPADISIDWDKASIGVGGKFSPVRHSENLYGDSAQRSSSNIIPPMGYVRDLVIPKEHIYFDGTKWVEVDLLPTVDNNSPALGETIKRSQGKSMSILLVLQSGESGTKYEFEFEVSSVDRIAWKDYQPTKRVPPPPNRPPEAHFLDQVTMAIIALGILGFSAYIFTVKKNQPTE